MDYIYVYVYHIISYHNIYIYIPIYHLYTIYFLLAFLLDPGLGLRRAGRRGDLGATSGAHGEHRALKGRSMGDEELLGVSSNRGTPNHHGFQYSNSLGWMWAM